MGDRRRPRVLIVDDEAPYRRVVSEILAASRLEVRFAVDAVQALEVLRTWNPDLMLLDVILPGVSGLSLLRRLREDSKWCSLPVILVSARAQQEDKDAGMAAGASAYMTKPFTSSNLRRALRRFISVPATGELDAG